MITETLFNAENITANSPQIEKLKALFPNCFDTSGRFLLEKFQAEISDHTEISREFYSMNWLGKSYAKLLRNLPPETLLAEDVEHNAKPENANSENLLIQGDNLEVLKHLKNAYVGEIKMIYIDPPYNTGSDGFIYHDDRQFSAEELAKLANIGEEEAARILSFTAKKSNSHSAWLTFMYPRLYIARELLSEDGVIFISIDDNELAQLKLLCDEIFGEDNFVEYFSWVKTSTPPSLSTKSRKTNEYILCYEKNKDSQKYVGENQDDGDEPLLNSGNSQRELLFPANTFSIKFMENGVLKSGKYEKVTLLNDVAVNNYLAMNDVKLIGEFKWTQDKLDDEILNGTTFIAKTDKLSVRFQRLNKGTKRPTNFIKDNIITPIINKVEQQVETNEGATKELIEFFGTEVFDYIKPVSLVQYLIKFKIEDSDIILDFFAGSGTTAHSVMKLNAERQYNNLKYICVQLPEDLDLALKTASKEAKKTIQNAIDWLDEQGKPHNIFEITKARIEKAAEKIVGADFMSARNNDTEAIRADIKSAPTKDFGFKIYKTVENFCAVSDADFSPEHEELPLFTHLNDEQRRTLLTTWALADGAKLNEKITEIRLGNYRAHLCEKRLYFVNEGLTSADLLAFIQKLDHDAEFNPNRVILLGSAIESRLQKELDQALATYANRKNIAISLIVRN